MDCGNGPKSKTLGTDFLLTEPVTTYSTSSPVTTYSTNSDVVLCLSCSVPLCSKGILNVR